jgi:hypothetical protein
MLNLVGWVIGIVLFVWATVSAFSIFSELKFLVDGWTWSVGQVPISIEAIALVVGKYVSGVVGGYREFVHGLVKMLHLPQLPSVAYDIVGVITFAVARGFRIGQKASARYSKTYRNSLPPNIESLEGGTQELIRERVYKETMPQFPLVKLSEIVDMRVFISLPLAVLGMHWVLSLIVVYGGAVGFILAALFGIDYLYRHLV